MPCRCGGRASLSRIPEAEHFLPALTTVRQDFAGLGRDIMSTLVEILRDDEQVETPVTVPELVVRDASGAARLTRPTPARPRRASGATASR